MAWAPAMKKVIRSNIMPSAAVGAGIGAVHGLMDSDQSMIKGAARGAIQGTILGGSIGLVQKMHDARIGHHLMGNKRL